MERYILVTHLVVRARLYMLKPVYDNLWIGYFVRTGYLIMKDLDAERVTIIKTQGAMIIYKIPVIGPDEVLEMEDPQSGSDNESDGDGLVDDNDEGVEILVEDGVGDEDLQMKSV